VAFRHGMIARLCEPGRTLTVALELAEAIARNAPLGVSAAKRILRQAPGRTEDELWPEQRSLVETVFASDDAREGARSFAEKRPPRWTGH
jgi:enoyl-CoA hydratase/carnithine racemase